MKSIKKSWKEEKIKRDETNQRGRWWARNIYTLQIVIKAYENFKLRRDQINHRLWKIASCKRIRRSFMRQIARKGATMKQRQVNQIRNMFTIGVGAGHFQYSKNEPMEILYQFLK